MGGRGSVTLRSIEGEAISRYPPSDSNRDLDPQRSPTFRHFLQDNAGQFVGTSSLDRMERLFTYRRVGTLPLVLNLSLPVDDIYAAWWRKAITIGSMLALLCGAIVALCQLFRRELKRRIKAEDGLLAAARQLTVMATTDGLTGVANRRAFDAELSRAWRAAFRRQSCLSLLMIDVDCFKLYNDQLGHPAGDRALSRVAACIASNTRRPGDVAARYGGEEFAALLPGTDAAGAMQTAECIRAAVAQLGIGNPGSPAGHITISIGVASQVPGDAEGALTLVTQADRALFDAKRGGRDRVALDGGEGVRQEESLAAD